MLATETGYLLFFVMQIYFLSSRGEASWTLPFAVSLELTPDQQDRIRDLIFEFERMSHSTARAKLTDSCSSPSSNGQRRDYTNGSGMGGHCRPGGESYSVKPDLAVRPGASIIAVTPGSRTTVYPPDSPSSSDSSSAVEYRQEPRSSPASDYMSMNGDHLKHPSRKNSHSK